MPIQGLQFTIPNSQERHQSYQATGSFIVYNPNDGVAYVATDRTATPLNFDYKVPSQSGGSFPGPINSYLSIYYLDQSGGGLSGQIHVYASPEKVNIPHFWSIGRALQTAGTTMDITMGNPPQNPPANTARLWADSSGNLNVTLGDGTTYKIADYNDQLGGILSGTLPNPQFSNGPFDMPSLLRLTALNSYISASGQGMELYYTGGQGTIQAYDRSDGGAVARPIVIAGSQLSLSPNGYILLSRANFQTPIITNGYHFDQVYSDGAIKTGDYLRLANNGYGVFNDASGVGIALYAANGVASDYSSGRVFARLPIAIGDTNFAAGDITQMWFWQLAPAGSSTSGSMTPMPGQLGNGTMTCTGYTGGRIFIIAELEITMSGSPGTTSGSTISLVLNGADANMRTAMPMPYAVGYHAINTYAYSAGYYSGIGIAYYWQLNGGGQLNVNTGIYSRVTAFELKK